MSRKSQSEARQAIALNYDGQTAPILSAKGDDELAQAILAIAREKNLVGSSGVVDATDYQIDEIVDAHQGALVMNGAEGERDALLDPANQTAEIPWSIRAIN